MKKMSLNSTRYKKHEIELRGHLLEVGEKYD